MERGLIVLVARAAAGQFDTIPAGIGAAQADGATPDMIREGLAFLVPYCGWPTALNALMAAGDVLPMAVSTADPLDAADRHTRRALGYETARRVNAGFDRVSEALRAIDPALADHLAESAYGYAYNRPGLDLVRRELLAVAILAVQGHDRQLLYHLRGARNVGATDADITDAIEALADVDAAAFERGRRAWHELFGRLKP